MDTSTDARVVTSTDFRESTRMLALLSMFKICAVTILGAGLCEACAARIFGVGYRKAWEALFMNFEGSFEKTSLNWMQNVCSAGCRFLSVEPLYSTPVRLKGDFTIIDPYELFFRSEDAAVLLERLRCDVDSLIQKHSELQVTYMGETAYFAKVDSWDEVAFELSRYGKVLGCELVPSKIIAMVPRKLVEIFLMENGDGFQMKGVSMNNVDGQVTFSGDGDFVVSSPESFPRRRRVSRYINDDCVFKAEFVCAAGGRWTYSDDSSDDEEELMEMEMEQAFYIAEDDE